MTQNGQTNQAPAEGEIDRSFSLHSASTASMLPGESARIRRSALLERLSLDPGAKVLGFLGLAHREDMELVGYDGARCAVEHRIRTHLRRWRPDLVVTCLATESELLMAEVCVQEGIPYVTVVFLDRMDVEEECTEEWPLRRPDLRSKARLVVFVADPLDAEGEEKAIFWIATRADRMYAISGEPTEDSMARLKMAVALGRPVRIEPLEFCASTYDQWVDDRFCDVFSGLMSRSTEPQNTARKEASRDERAGDTLPVAL